MKPKAVTRFKPPTGHTVDSHWHSRGHPEDNLDDHTIRNGFTDKQLLSNETASAKDILVDAWLEGLTGDVTVFAEFNRLGQRVLATSQIPGHVPKQPVKSIYATVDARAGWWKTLADANVPLYRLGGIPTGTRPADVLNLLCQHKIPLVRAGWIIRIEARRDQDWTRLNLQHLENLLAARQSDTLNYFYRLLQWQYRHCLLNRLSFLHALIPLFRTANFTTTMLMIPLVLHFVPVWATSKSWIEALGEISRLKMQRLSNAEPNSQEQTNLVHAQYVMLARICQFSSLVAPHLVAPCSFPIGLYPLDGLLKFTDSSLLPSPTIGEQRWNSLQLLDVFNLELASSLQDATFAKDLIWWATNTPGPMPHRIHAVVYILASVPDALDKETLLDGLSRGDADSVELLYSLFIQRNMFAYQFYLYRCLAKRSNMNVRLVRNLPAHGQEVQTLRSILLDGQEDQVDLAEIVRAFIPSLYKLDQEASSWTDLEANLSLLKTLGICWNSTDQICQDLWRRIRDFVVPSDATITKNNWWFTSPGSSLLTGELFARISYIFERFGRRQLCLDVCVWLLNNTTATSNAIYRSLYMCVGRNLASFVALGIHDLEKAALEKQVALKKSRSADCFVDGIVNMLKRPQIEAVISPPADTTTMAKEEVVKELAHLRDEPDHIALIAKNLTRAAPSYVVEAVFALALRMATTLDQNSLEKRLDTLAALCCARQGLQNAIVVWMERGHLHLRATPPITPITPMTPMTPMAVKNKPPGPLCTEGPSADALIHLMTLLVRGGALPMHNVVTWCHSVYAMSLDVAMNLASGFSAHTEVPSSQRALASHANRLIRSCLLFDEPGVAKGELDAALALMVPPVSFHSVGPLLELVCNLLALDAIKTDHMGQLARDLLKQDWLKCTLQTRLIWAWDFVQQHGYVREAQVSDATRVSIFAHVLNVDSHWTTDNPKDLFDKLFKELNDVTCDESLIHILSIVTLRSCHEELAECFMDYLLGGLSDRLAWRLVQHFPPKVCSSLVTRATALMRTTLANGMPGLVSKQRSTVLTFSKIVAACCKLVKNDRFVLDQLFESMHRQMSWFDSQATVFEVMDVVACTFQVAQHHLVGGSVASAVSRILGAKPQDARQDDFGLQDAALAFETRLRIAVECLDLIPNAALASWAILAFRLLSNRIIVGSWQRMDDFQTLLDMAVDCFHRSSKDARARMVLSFQEAAKSMNIPPHLASQVAVLLPFASWETVGEKLKPWDLIEDLIDPDDRAHLNHASINLATYQARRVGKERDTATMQAYKDGWLRLTDLTPLVGLIPSDFLESSPQATPKRIKTEDI
jgi:hypothetical protein